jgi:hypothetical protein
MKLEDLLGDIEKAAESTTKPAQSDDKPRVSKELDALLTKEATASNATRAFEEGEKIAKALLEKLAEDAIANAVTDKPAEKQEPKQEVAPVEKAAEEKKEEVKPEETKAEVEKKAEEKPADQTETKEEDMNKQAQDAGKELATAIIEKLAAMENEAVTGPGKLKEDTAKAVSQHDARIQPMPGRNGTLNQMFDAVFARAKAMGPTGVDQMATGAQAKAESKDPAMGTPSIPVSPDFVDKTASEKQAAVQALCEAGMDWDSAVDLVKSAAEEIAKEEISQVKMAAVSQLVEEGVDFDTAVENVNAAVQEVTADEGK